MSEPRFKRTSLCEDCTHVRVIESQRGSRFLLCQLAQADENYLKYPPQPVVRCPGYLPSGERDS